MSATIPPDDRRPCHDWHWIECDRRNVSGPCQREGREHVRIAGHERALWLCQQHAAEARASAEYRLTDKDSQAGLPPVPRAPR